jgi:hypothetical protein
MKRIEIFALAIGVFVLGTPAYAGDDKFSLLRCGLQWGGSSMEARTVTAAKKPPAFDTRGSLVPLYSGRPVAHSFFTSRAGKKERRRLPRTITVAKVGCTWR